MNSRHIEISFPKLLGQFQQQKMATKTTLCLKGTRVFTNKGTNHFIWEISDFSFHQHCCIIIVLCICVYLMEPFLCWAMWSIGFYLFSICTCTLKQHYISWMQFTCNITVFIWKVDFHEFKMKHFYIELTLKNIECKYYVSHWSRVINTSILLK